MTGLAQPFGMVAGPYGAPFAPGWSLFYGPTGNTFFPLGTGKLAEQRRVVGLQTIWARNAVINVHIGIPHRHDAGRDDIQLLYNNEALKNQFYYSASDMASSFCTGAAAVSGPACMYPINGETLSTLTGGAIPFGTSLPVTYMNTYTWGCQSAVGNTFDAAALNSLGSCVRPYGFPNGVNVGSPAIHRVFRRMLPTIVQQHGDHEDPIHEELRFDRLPSDLRIHVLQRLVSQRTLQHQLLLFLLPARARLRAEYPHARP